MLLLTDSLFHLCSRFQIRPDTSDVSPIDTVDEVDLSQKSSVRTFFDSTQSQESKSEVCAKEFCAAMHIEILLNNALYLSSLWSDLST